MLVPAVLVINSTLSYRSAFGYDEHKRFAKEGERGRIDGGTGAPAISKVSPLCLFTRDGSHLTAKKGRANTEGRFLFGYDGSSHELR